MSKKTAAPLLIGQLANGTGINIETIRYYEREGLISAPLRTSGGHRAYEGQHVQRLAFIRRSRELGFSLNDVRKLLQLADNGAMCTTAAKELTARHLEDVRGKIKSLKKLEKALATIATACAPGESFPCPILEALSTSAPGSKLIDHHTKNQT
ncbi:MAG: helix-turn-helix domain-containing protein [Rhizobiales bacterium]|nr:helix-turn-helix domain-containing protein [Hyphomicrobiales bacterium]